MTYSIVARDPATGEMGIASQSQAFAVGGSVPFAEPGFGVIATQSMAEPLYGQLGLDLLRDGLTAQEALTALRSIDPHPERRQVAIIDSRDDLAAYTGAACIDAAGHVVDRHCCALANMVESEAVWHAMVDAYQSESGTLAHRLTCALEAAEREGGDIRGRRSAAVLVVRARRTGRPWRDALADLRIDDSPEPVREIRRLVDASERYHRTVQAFETALDGDPASAIAQIDALHDVNASDDPDQVMWRAVILALAGRAAEASTLFDELAQCAPEFLEAARRFVPAGLLPDADALRRLLPAGD